MVGFRHGMLLQEGWTMLLLLVLDFDHRWRNPEDGTKQVVVTSRQLQEESLWGMSLSWFANLV